MNGLRPLVERVVRSRGVTDHRRSALVAVSGIDGGGKGYVTARAAELLEQHRLRNAIVNVDGF